MTAVLPAGHTFRRPTKDDASAIFELVAARNTAAVGFADFTLDDMLDELAEPGFDLDLDGWLVFTGDALAGYGTVFGKGDHQLLDIDLYAADPAVAEWLLARIYERAQELGRAHGRSEVTLDVGVYRAETGKRELLAGDEFAPGTTYHRMRIDHTGPVTAPDVPAGVVLRRGALDEATRRTAHALLTESFTGQYGFMSRSYEEWFAGRDAQSTFDWSQLHVLELDGRAVAFIENNDQFIEDENCNYVSRLGVLEEARGRGLAKFLLRDAFAADAAAGRTGTILHVDTNNPTPALGLYLSVGMAAVLVIDVWRRTLPVA
ncbi:GNAT family N-acetyltransferase [Streptomyces sp. SID13031]|uniref:GNAT family N-acetyltransferase n=1 Tax=Streptomyces sp. SID13031 TaxID=2706046 RepID=UPI0013CCA669|nr:GNAT family N-acetyltransferase [Streptomyces sp. SID13031]NEA33049.1 GNAT family N-acetyltransferase [Streptomyces sp. SID13031]